MIKYTVFNGNLNLNFFTLYRNDVKKNGQCPKRRPKRSLHSIFTVPMQFRDIINIAALQQNFKINTMCGTWSSIHKNSYCN
jgi:hypothetical protein